MSVLLLELSGKNNLFMKYMRAIILKYKIIIICSILGIITGLIIENNSDKTYLWRVGYCYDQQKISNNNKLVNSDTIVVINNITIRNFTYKDADLRDNGCKHQEFKIYTNKENTKNEVYTFANSILENKHEIFKTSFISIQDNNYKIINYTILGFFLGICLNFIVNIIYRDRDG